jgi:hypothetical protein
VRTAAGVQVDLDLAKFNAMFVELMKAPPSTR